MMSINFYISRSTYCFILMYICGLTVVIKRICYVIEQAQIIAWQTFV